MSDQLQFKDREEAGKLLSQKLASYANQKNNLVVALPRGGVVVGYEMAKALSLPLDIVSPRKIGAPGNPEYAVGAITESGEAIISDDVHVDPLFLKESIAKERKEAERRLAYYRQGMPPREFVNKRVILVDDGLATGATMRAAIAGLRKEGVASIIVAVPVAPKDTAAKIAATVDAFHALLLPDIFFSVGQFYQSFPQTSDEEVLSLLHSTDIR